jgi:hypothetical protein
MSELKQLKQISQLDAANVGGGDGDCPTTVTVGTGGVNVQETGPSVADMVYNAASGTYEGIIEATSYAIERVINAVSSN